MATRQRVKAERNAQNADKRPRAVAKNLGVSPSKVRIVLNIIRGKDYAEAVAILKNMPNVGAEYAVKVLESAGANAENNLGLNKDNLYVKEAFINEGRTLKRMRFGSRGHVEPIKKRTSHITIVVSDRN